MTDLQHINAPIVNLKDGTATTVFYKYLQSLKSIASDFDSGDTSGQTTYSPLDFVLQSDIDFLVQAIAELKSLLFGSQIVHVSSDVDVVAGVTYICTAPLTATLTANPEDNETATVITTNGTVTLDGNGKTIIGDSTYSMVVNFESKHLLFSAELDGWLFI